MAGNPRSGVLFDERGDEYEGDASPDDERLIGEGINPAVMASHYRLSKNEVVRGLANRIVHSRAYILLYLGMALLSLTTVVLSLVGDCPPFAFYVLEVVVNTVMILEVTTRVVAFGEKYFKSWFNLLDLGMTVLCVVTLLVVFLTPCTPGNKGEEVFDTLLLVARNFFQFFRLALLMRKSGTSIFHRPPPIDLSQARQAALALDIDLDDDEAVAESALRPTFAIGGSGGYELVGNEERRTPSPPRVGVTAQDLREQRERGRNELTEEDEDAWDRLG